MAQDIYSSFGQGLTQGVNMGLTIDQAREQRRAREWQKDMQLVNTFMDYAKVKGVSNSTAAESVNQANGIIKKWYPKANLPTLTPEQVPDYAPVLKTYEGLLQAVEKDPSKAEFAISEFLKTNDEWGKTQLKGMKMTEMQKWSRDTAVKTLTEKSKGKDGSGGAGLDIQKRLERALLALREGAYTDNIGVRKTISNRQDAIDFLTSPSVGLDPEKHPELGAYLEKYKPKEAPKPEGPGLFDKVIEGTTNAIKSGVSKISGMGSSGNPIKEPTATGPNGERVVYRNGQWVPL